MDLSKIIGELREELHCLETAITSMEELARVQNLLDSEMRQAVSPSPETGPQDQPQVKRGRGRPRKNPLPSGKESQMSPSAPSNDDSSFSAA